jgi:hypothetical protein
MNTKLLIGALALAGAIALPATAALSAPPPPQFSFNLSIGDGNGGDFGNGPHHDDHPHHDDRCMSSREILGDLADQGFSRFIPVDRDRHSFTVDARRHFRWFELTVDSCDGEILNIDRIAHP